MSLNKELDRFGRRLQVKMKAYALPNKDTGRLDKSILYTTSSVGREKFKLEVFSMYYGKYLNARTHFFDRAFNDTFEPAIRDMINVQSREIFEDVLEMDWGN